MRRFPVPAEALPPGAAIAHDGAAGRSGEREDRQPRTDPDGDRDSPQDPTGQIVQATGRQRETESPQPSPVKQPETTHALAPGEGSRHHTRGADNAEYRRVCPPNERLSLLGVRGHKARRLARITPCDLCRIVNPRRQPAAGNGLTSHCVGNRHDLPLSRPTHRPAHRDPAADAREDRG